MRERIMFKGTKRVVVCDAECRAEALRRLERERDQLILYAWRRV